MDKKEEFRFWSWKTPKGAASEKLAMDLKNQCSQILDALDRAA